jgi:hypothetical protein
MSFLPVYSRADLSRTVVFVVALSVTAAATAALAREFRAADTQNEDYPTVQARRYMGSLVTDFDCKPFEPAMTGIYARAQRDPAAAQLIERIRKAE